MNLETELRTAMAEHVSDVTAASDLVAGVRRRHRRRTLRNRALTGAAIATAAAVTIPFLVLKGSGSDGEQPGQPALAPPSKAAEPDETVPPADSVPLPASQARLCPPDSQPLADSTSPGGPKNGNVPDRAGPPATSIDGVEATYLPARVAGLPAQQSGADPSTKSWGYGIKWSDARNDSDPRATTVSLLVLCGPEARGAGLLEGLNGWQPTATAKTIKGASGRYEPLHAAWMVRPGVAIDVKVSKNVNLDKVIAGIKVTT